MNILLNKNDLQTALQSLIKITPSRTTLPILHSVLFESVENSLIIRGTDLEVSMKISLNTSFNKFNPFVISLKKLNEIVNEIKDEEINIEINDKQINIKTSLGTYSLMSKNPEEFPSWTETKKEKSINFEKEELNDIISKTLYAVSKDEIKPALQGVLFDNRDNKLNIVATDGAKLVKIDFKGENSLEKEIIIPTKFLSIIRSCLKKENKIFISDNHISIQLENMEISSRLINQKFPDYSSVIPMDNDKRVRINKESFYSSVKRVSIFSNRSTNQINLHFNENKLTISTSDPENVSSGTETIECDYIGEEISIGFNGDYLKETIKNQKEETIEFSMKSSVSATLFKGSKNNTRETLSLLMPIRISE